MEKEKTLREMNAGYLWTFFAYNVLLLVAFSSLIDINNLKLESFILIKGTWVVIAPLILFVLNGILSDEQKETISHWKYPHPKPGCRAFTEHAPNDDRVDMKMLIAKHGILPQEPKDQNALWYKLYSKHAEVPVIRKSQQDYLLAIDLCSISFLFLVIASWIVILISPESYKWFYVAFLALQYLVMCVITQNKSRSFVCDVLAHDAEDMAPVKPGDARTSAAAG